MTELSIIIVHHRTPEHLKLCLDSLKKTIGNISHEVIVVDSMSTRRTKEIISERYPEAIFIPHEINLGFSRGVNIGIKQSKGQYILILNPDVIATEGGIATMLDFMKKHGEVGLLGPKILNFNGTIQKKHILAFTNR